MRRSSALKCWGGEVRVRRASRPASRRSQLSLTTTSRSKKFFPGFSCQIQQKRTLKAFASTQTRRDSDPHGSGPGDAAAGRALGSQCGPGRWRLPNLPPAPRLTVPLDETAGTRVEAFPSGLVVSKRVLSLGVKADSHTESRYLIHLQLCAERGTAIKNNT